MSNRRSWTQRAGILCLITVALAFISGCSLPKIIILKDPLSAEEHANLGRIYESQGKTDLAVQQYEAAVKADPKTVTFLLLLGDISFRTGNYDAAESAYKKAIVLQPENGDIYNNLSWVYLKQDRNLEQAHELTQKALIATPTHRGYYLDTLGVVFLKLNRIEDAIIALREAVVLIPGDQVSFLSEAYTHLADAYRKKGDEVQARDTERKAQLLGNEGQAKSAD